MSLSAIAGTPSPPISQPSATSNSRARKTRATDELTPEEVDEVKELEKRDDEVRRHEEAHRAAAGQYARGGPKYEFQTGPDGERYAVGGEVEIDTAPIDGDPAATIRKADQIKRAALAPGDPSPKDRQVAADAERMKSKAAEELAEETAKEMMSEPQIPGAPASRESDSSPSTERVDTYA